MNDLKNIAYIAVVVLTALAVGCVAWFSGSYFFSLNAQVNQNTQNIQAIVQYMNQKVQASPTPSVK